MPTRQGASFGDIVDVTSYHTDMHDVPLYMQVRDHYFTTGSAILPGRPLVQSSCAARRGTSWK